MTLSPANYICLPSS